MTRFSRCGPSGIAAPTSAVGDKVGEMTNKTRRMKRQVKWKASHVMNKGYVMRVFEKEHFDAAAS